MNLSHFIQLEEQYFNLLPLYFILPLSILVFCSLFLVGSPYGRHDGTWLGFTINARLAWIIQESFSFICIPVFIYMGNNSKFNIMNIIILSYFIFHYIQRSLIFPLLMRGNSTMPFLIFLFASIWCIYNGYIQGRYFGYYSNYPLDWYQTPQFIIGNIIFFVGMMINIHSDHILRNLRKKNEKGYKIPRGGLFEYVSCANFFGEIVEWIGFFILSCSPQALAFVIFTIANLLPRGIKHHQWYKKKFEDYPKQRKAIFPFIL